MRMISVHGLANMDQSSAACDCRVFASIESVTQHTLLLTIHAQDELHAMYGILVRHMYLLNCTAFH